MANWSSDTYYFGRLLDRERAEDLLVKEAALRGSTLDFHYTRLQHEIVTQLRWLPEEQWMFRLYGLQLRGCVVELGGSGKWGAPLPLTAECWDWLRSGVVVYEGHDGFIEDFVRTITIAGEVVLEQRQSMFPKDDSPEAEEEYRQRDTRWPRFEGRNPEERHFFERLFALLDARWARNQSETP